ncbi:hypothetical protein CROQUDRAFT_85485 [Cronartium quercuum f. sp. fusiforme G11]|uniref:Uncharacterized protein n=1 Tax=Cronartium quercuum f. sp. fusiforme G11 TaxID=708437 RepID=A0A9P6NY02_9BASI|nr:hypothetical protein CROQUDRAFT_85485 [Cronartium quercuum f. sp. fusiforme G11]
MSYTIGSTRIRPSGVRFHAHRARRGYVFARDIRSLSWMTWRTTRAGGVGPVTTRDYTRLNYTTVPPPSVRSSRNATLPPHSTLDSSTLHHSIAPILHTSLHPITAFYHQSRSKSTTTDGADLYATLPTSIFLYTRLGPLTPQPFNRFVRFKSSDRADSSLPPVPDRFIYLI